MFGSRNTKGDMNKNNQQISRNEQIHLTPVNKENNTTHIVIHVLLQSYLGLQCPAEYVKVYDAFKISLQSPEPPRTSLEYC